MLLFVHADAIKLVALPKLGFANFFRGSLLSRPRASSGPMEGTKKRKRDADLPRITYDAGTRTFDRLFKGMTLSNGAFGRLNP